MTLAAKSMDESGANTSLSSETSDRSRDPAFVSKAMRAVVNLFGWYSTAVTSPATDKEKAEWQQNSF